MKRSIYLDYNASCPLRPQAKDALSQVYNIDNAALNASAVHQYGREGRKIIENARQNIAALVGAQTNQVIFNSGATEGNNTVIKHFLEYFPNETIAVSSIEHPSVLDVSPKLLKIPVDEHGIITPSTLKAFLEKHHAVGLVSIMIANNETGVIQNIAQLSAIIHNHGALFHCDATQAAGKIPINITEMGIDFLTLSSHKIGGSQGVGVLILGQCGQTPTLLIGGGQEKSARAGTENVAGIASFGAAAQAILTDINAQTKFLNTLQKDLEEKLIALRPEIIIHAKNATRLPNTTFFSLPFATSQTMMMAFDLIGIALSNGSACSSGTVKPSRTLLAMGCTPNIAASSLRVSTGWATTKKDIDDFMESFETITMRIKNKQ